MTLKDSIIGVFKWMGGNVAGYGLVFVSLIIFASVLFSWPNNHILVNIVAVVIGFVVLGLGLGAIGWGEKHRKRSQV